MNAKPLTMTWGGRLRRILGTPFRPGIGRDISAVFVVLGIVGLFAAQAAEYELQRQEQYGRLLNTTGHLRTLSQRIALTAQRAAQNDIVAKEFLPKLNTRFDEELRFVEQTGLAQGMFLKENDARILARLKTEWQQTRTATNALLSVAPSSLQAQEQLQLIDSHSAAVLDAAEDAVQSIFPYFAEERARLRFLVPAAALFGVCVATSTYLYIRRRLYKPLKEIVDMSHRFANGDLEARVSYEADDEIGRLVKTINRTAAAIRTLMHKHARAAQVVRDSELRNRTLWEIISDAIIIVDAHNIIRFANPASAQLFGYTPDELVGQDTSIVQPVQLRETYRQNLERYQRYHEKTRRGVTWHSIETLALHKSGKEVPVELAFSHMAMSGEDWYVGFFRDISRRIEDQAALRLRDRAIESSRDGIMITDAQTANHPILYINPAIARISGYSPEEVIGHSGRIFLGDNLQQPEANTLRDLLREGKEGSVILACYRKDHVQFWNELTVSPVRDENARITHYISIFKDVTERKRQEAALLKSANFDALTELPNRVLLLDRLDLAISSGIRHNRKVGLLFINLDNFKVINDSLGHDAGNTLIQKVAKRLHSCLWDGDTLARVGGDEFVFLLDEIGNEENIIGISRRIFDSLTKPLELGGQEVVISASIGASVFPRDGESAATLLQRANLAMHRAKEQGHNNFQFFTEEMHSRINHRLTMETQLRKAIEREEFVLYFQPQVKLANSRIVGAEALIRWKHPEMGLLAPGQFIPLAEETGLIVPIGEWVLHTACSEAKRWQGALRSPIVVAVNLSARQFRQNNLLDVIHKTLTFHGMQPSQLELEITESLVMHEPEKTTILLRQMKEMGLHISLDDFGTGYSSLAYLKNFPVDRLKIDKSFIQDVAIVRAVIQLARSFNLETIAEGVEDKDTLHLLRHLNCDIVQGYYFAHPMPADAFMDWLASGIYQGQGHEEVSA